MTELEAVRQIAKDQQHAVEVMKAEVAVLKDVIVLLGDKVYDVPTKEGLDLNFAYTVYREVKGTRSWMNNQKPKEKS